MFAHYNLDWLTEKFDSGEPLEFIFFWGNTDRKTGATKACFSQWYESKFTVDGITYNTAEHWMMAQKALLFGDKDCFDKIIASTKPGEAKELGRTVSGFDELIWNDRRIEIVTAGNIHKFNQNKNLYNFLIATGNKILVEASPVDTIWGVGLSSDSQGIENIYTWRGLNLLGFSLMEARDFLIKHGHFDYLVSPILPPWKKYPDKDAMDMYWRMGNGEEYIAEFSHYFDKLTPEQQTIFKLNYPTPSGWHSFYNS